MRTQPDELDSALTRLSLVAPRVPAGTPAPGAGVSERVGRRLITLLAKTHIRVLSPARTSTATDR